MHRRDYILSLSTIASLSLAGCTGSGTADLEIDRAEVQNNAEQIGYDGLMRDTDQHEGASVHFPQAQIVQVMEDDDVFQLRAYVTEEEFVWDDDILIWWEGDRFLEDDIVEVWGRFEGLITYETVLGDERTIPELVAADIEIVEES
ncbi:hypothetical protein [Natrialba swarupiae]|uniref:Uncharacterized protein n=1 Tax=Natrialba swarupiae TaxID=2448032 RepID=A0A5D5AHE7_9EURY|nr:hypothetical protein [Natrialba swarupiae]TYT60257.1 hypothetical protein FYC77_19900 [Natrialba swarupiae]